MHNWCFISPDPCWKQEKDTVNHEMPRRLAPRPARLPLYLLSGFLAGNRRTDPVNGSKAGLRT